MTQNKEEIIADMLDNGLLSDEDAERYLADKSVTVAELEEIKRLIQLCRSRENSKLYPFEKIENKIREKYFSEQSDESMTDDATYRQQILRLIEKSEKDFEEGNSISIEDYSGELEERYKNKISENRKEEQEAIEAIIRRGEDDIKNGRLYTEEEFYKEIGLDLSLPPKYKTLKELLSRGDITKEEYEKYMSDDNFSDADAMEMKAIEDIVRNGEEDMKNGRYSPFEESWKRIMEANVDDNCSSKEEDAIEAIIRRGKDDIKNGRLYTEEEFFKKIGISPENLEKDDYEAIRSCEDDIKQGIDDIIRRGEEDLKNGNMESWEDTLKKVKAAREDFAKKGTNKMKTKSQNLKIENGMIINEAQNTFMPVDKKELEYLEKMADEAMEEIKAGKCKPFKDFKWFRDKEEKMTNKKKIKSSRPEKEYEESIFFSKKWWKKAIARDVWTEVYDVNARNHDGSTPLMFAAAYNCNPAVIEELVKLGADVNETDNLGWTPLIWAVKYNDDTDIIRTLAKLGADLNHLTKMNEAPLTYAAERDEPVEMVKTLIECGADVNFRNTWGDPILLGICGFKNVSREVIGLFVDAGVDLEAKDKYGETILMYASINNSHSEVLRALVEYGADIAAENPKGETAFDLAKYNDNPRIQEFLITLGAIPSDRKWRKPDYSTKEKALEQMLKDGFIDEKQYQEELANEKTNLHQIINEILVPAKIIAEAERLGGHPFRTHSFELMEALFERDSLKYNDDEDD